jgi:hypothetical protein
MHAPVNCTAPIVDMVERVERLKAYPGRLARISSPIIRHSSGKPGGLKGAVDAPAADPQVFGYVG